MDNQDYKIDDLPEYVDMNSLWSGKSFFHVTINYTINNETMINAKKYCNYLLSIKVRQGNKITSSISRMMSEQQTPGVEGAGLYEPLQQAVQLRTQLGWWEY